MAQYKFEELHGVGKYHIFDNVMKDFFENGCNPDYEEQTWLEMLFIKHTLLAAEKMKQEGDTVVGITDAVSPSCYAEVNSDENA